MHDDAIASLRRDITTLIGLKKSQTITGDSPYILHKGGTPLKTAYIEDEIKCVSVPLSIVNIGKATTFTCYEKAVRIAEIANADVDHPHDVLTMVIDEKTRLLELLDPQALTGANL